jgi:hypothetical protein
MPQGTVAAPTPLLIIVLAQLTEFCLPRTLCQILCKDATFQEIEFGCQQMADVCETREEEYRIPISINVLMRVFECPRNSMQSAVAHDLESPGERGKQTALDQHREQQLVDWTQQNPNKAHQSGKQK